MKDRITKFREVIHSLKAWNSSEWKSPTKKKKSINEEIKSRLKSRNACYHTVKNILYSSWLQKDIKIKLCKNIIFAVVLYGCEA
jgi:hypothetical protein